MWSRLSFPSSCRRRCPAPPPIGRATSLSRSISKDVGTWTSPGDFGDKRGVYTPDWWTLKGSQYGMLKTWRIARDGTYVDGVKISPVSLKDLELGNHNSIRLRIGVKDNAKHPGGLNIFGRGFGNYDQDIILRINTAR